MEAEMDVQEGLVSDSEQKIQTEKEALEHALEQAAKTNKLWLWMMFLLASSPGALNGMHITSYVFLAGNGSHYCSISELENAGWNPQQVKNISLPTESTYEAGCEYLNWNYSEFAELGYTKAIAKSAELPKPRSIPCMHHVFEEPNTVISEWNLICDKFYERSNIQSSFALGKFIGAFVFGIIADKIGRKYSFTLAAACYVVSAPLAAFLHSYYVFLFVRFIIGFAGVGCYGTAYTLLSELVMGPARTWACTLYNVPYPIGMMVLSLIAYETQSWRTLQILMSLPTLLLPLHCWLLPESPPWLFSQGRREEAWKIMKKIQPSCSPPPNIVQYDKISEKCLTEEPWYKKVMDVFKKFFSMFSTGELARRTLICYFIWFSSSVNYYGLVLNGGNFNIDRYIYIALSGVFEILSYVAPIPMLAIMGRKLASFLLLAVTAISLLSILLLPASSYTVILSVALLGRFCASSVFVIFALHTAELFPTSIRNTAIGTSLTMSHVGTIIAPYIVDILGAYGWYIPSTVFGLFALLGVIAIIPLPETRNKPLYNNIEEMKNAMRLNRMRNN